MIAVIFELTPAEGGRDAYLDLAAALRPELDEIDGFVSIERFESLATPGRLLSLSWWRDAEAVARWRARPSHRRAQMAGRAGILADYRLRVATVLRDYGMTDRAEAPYGAPSYSHACRAGVHPDPAGPDALPPAGGAPGPAAPERD